MCSTGLACDLRFNPRCNVPVIPADKMTYGEPLASHVQGVGMIFDFYQQRNKETDPNAIGGWAGSFSYDFAVAGAACGMEVDYVPGR